MFKCEKCGNSIKGYIVIGMWLEQYEIEEGVREDGTRWGSAVPKEIMENKKICSSCSKKIMRMFK